MTIKEAATKAVIGVRRFWIIETALTQLFILKLAGWWTESALIGDSAFTTCFSIVFTAGICGYVLGKPTNS